MSRSVYFARHEGNCDGALRYIHERLIALGYRQEQRTDNKLNPPLIENIYVKGDGFLIARRCIKFYQDAGGIRFEAWMNIFFDSGESKLEGFYGWAVKKQTKNDINALLAYVEQDYAAQAAYYQAQQAAQKDEGELIE